HQRLLRAPRSSSPCEANPDLVQQGVSLRACARRFGGRRLIPRAVLARRMVHAFRHGSLHFPAPPIAALLATSPTTQLATLRIQSGSAERCAIAELPRITSRKRRQRTCCEPRNLHRASGCANNGCITRRYAATRSTSLYHQDSTADVTANTTTTRKIGWNAAASAATTSGSTTALTRSVSRAAPTRAGSRRASRRLARMAPS